MKQIHETDDGISPVVGIMLMVVVTVIIAAAIIGFSTGIVGDDTESTPVVILEVGDLAVGSVCLTSVDFVHKGGDPFSLDYIEFSFVGGKQNIANYFFTPSPRNDVYSDGTVEIVGKSGVTVSAGDTIKITISGDEDEMYYPFEEVAWTLYDLRTDAVIADGTFIVPDSS